MARITVEDCLKKIDSQYELVLLAKERTSQLNAGDPMLVSNDNDKNTVVALREIAEGKISIKTLEDLGIEKLRKNKENKEEELEDIADDHEDDFDKIYKGEISKSGTAILPSKRSKRIPEKIKNDFKGTDDKVDIQQKNKDLETETNTEVKTEEEPLSEENKAK